MLFPDVNVCLLAMAPDLSAQARQVRDWLTGALNGHEAVGFAEQVLASVVRIATHPRVFNTPATPVEAIEFADALLRAPSAIVVRPGARHWSIFTDLVTTHRVRGNDIPDAFLAAVALEVGATVVTLDRGFRRYPLRTIDPTAD
jgi:toxin-antitoxin system PIN domain toxin